MVLVGYLLGILVGIFLSAAFVDTSTHWIVTEDGKLQEQPDSMLSMKRPHDLVAFMHQEERVDSIEQLKAYIAEHQEIVDSTDDKDDGFEERFLATEESCIKAVKRLPEFDLYISTVLPLENKGIRAEDHINLRNPPSTEYSSPHCTSPLSFSIHAFEHLEGVQNRKNLRGTPELGLTSAITHRESEDEYGHLVNEALKQNQTSWVLYNMAAFYWRIKGDPNEAIECLRRAMHYSPRSYIDIAYVSLGNILHRSKYSHEAAVVLEAALDLSSSLNVNHFTLGNIYAVLTEYNRSIACFDNTLLLQPDFDAAEKRRWAVICYSKLEQALETQHRNLQIALEKLKEYQKKHESMQTLTEKIVMEQAYRTDRVTRNSEFTEHKHLRRQEGHRVMGEHCEVVSNDNGQAVVCEWKETDMDVNNSHQTIDIERRFSSIPITDTELERLRVETDRLKVLEDGSYRDDVVAARQDYSKPIRPPIYSAGESVQPISKPDQPLHLDPAWPSKEECDENQAKMLTWDEYPTTFLPPENKGFDSRVFLADAIDIQAGDEHPLPWYPPVCVNIVDLKQGEMFLDHINAFKQRDKVTLRSTDSNLKKVMLSWVNNGEVEEEEVGQRILTALKQNLAPRWLLYNLAGLYWRVVGNNYHAIECLRRSLHFVPADYVDVPLVNVANIFIKWGQFEDALNMTRQALIFCPFEPITHLTQANVLAIVNNETGAIYHYEKALEYNPSYSEALDMLRNLKCFSKYEKAAIIQADRNTCKANNAEKQHNCATMKIVQNCPSTLSLCANELLPSDSSDDFLSLGAFLRKNKMLDETEANAMKEFHKVNGLCSGVECDHIVHKPGTDPYIKIKVASPGKWIQRLLFIGPNEELEAEDGECYLLMDKQRKGCFDAEFITNEKRVLQLEKVLTELLQFIKNRQEAGELLAGEDEKIQEKVKIKDGGEVVELDGFVDIDQYLCQNGRLIKICGDTGCDSLCVDGPTASENTDIVCVTVEDKDQIRCFSKKDATPDQIELPEVKPRQNLKLPSVKFKPTDSDCDHYKDIDFKAFTSTWLSVAPREIEYDVDNQVTLADVSEFLNLEETIRPEDKEAPICEAKFGASVFLFDHLPSIADKEKLKYSTENVLKDIIQVLGGVEESVDVVGTRISRALEKNRASWVLGCLGALYWRVRGHAPNAITCLKMALMNAPADRRHIPLLSLANILHKAGAINDALSIALEALESSPETVVIHFSIGNMYAAKDDFAKAIEYYQSTLALQEKFEPARERLIAIMCGDLMSEEPEEEEEPEAVEESEEEPKEDD